MSLLTLVLSLRGSFLARCGESFIAVPTTTFRHLYADLCNLLLINDLRLWGDEGDNQVSLLHFHVSELRINDIGNVWLKEG